MQFIKMKLHYTSEQWYIAWGVGLRLMGGVCRLGWKFQSITRHQYYVGQGPIRSHLPLSPYCLLYAMKYCDCFNYTKLYIYIYIYIKYAVLFFD